MKPFYWIDVTDKKNKFYNIEEFNCWQVSQEAQNASAVAKINKEKFQKKARLPLPLRIIKIIMSITLVISFASLPEADESKIVLIVLIAICVVIISILNHMAKKRLEKYSESQEWAQILENEKACANRCINEFVIPENAMCVEFLSGIYKVNNGEYNLNVRKQTLPIYNNLRRIINVEDGNLYITTYPKKYCIPNFKPIAIERIEKKVGYIGWYKSEKYNSATYKSYNIKGNSDDVYTCKWYYVLHFEANGENWRLFFPPYELSNYEKLTGLKAE